jgi:hypothetical protein
MNDPFQEFKFMTPTLITINGREAVIKADGYQSSQEQYLRVQGGNAALLRFYSITYAGEMASHLINEIEVIGLIGQDQFSKF